MVGWFHNRANLRYQKCANESQGVKGTDPIWHHIVREKNYLAFLLRLRPLLLYPANYLHPKKIILE